MMKKLLLCAIFFCLSPLVLLIVTYNGIFENKGSVLGKSDFVSSPSEILYASLPETAESNFIVPAIEAEDSIPIVIENYLKRYNSPLLSFKDDIVKNARENKVDPRLIVAIAQQESNLGKSSPEGCNNAWGWGIHARGTTCFENWKEAISVVIKGIAKNYCAKGLCDDPCVMMKKYTPKSNGSWCRGVNQFLSELETGNF